MNPWPYLRQAARAAQRSRVDRRAYAVGAVAVRADGAVTASRNANAEAPRPAAHAERRVLRKAGVGAEIYVARVRHDGSLALARPCHACQTALRARRVERCVYTVADGQFGVIWPCGRTAP